MATTTTVPLRRDWQWNKAFRKIVFQITSSEDWASQHRCWCLMDDWASDSPGHRRFYPCATARREAPFSASLVAVGAVFVDGCRGGWHFRRFYGGEELIPTTGAEFRRLSQVHLPSLLLGWMFRGVFCENINIFMRNIGIIAFFIGFFLRLRYISE